MPRSNRPRRNGRSRSNAPRQTSGEPRYEEDWVERARYGVVRLQDAPDGQWHVRKIGAMGAGKTYTCPGCHGVIAVGLAHIVAWRADHWSGDDASAAARRHWHERCWSTRSYRY
ncbi:hypothetical protein [Glutamicibacter uratoxydans]|uniref:hypothetical protein n=1 Tax=Glutamicibacter uratoxydans TaxID=43667 RepID=UPI003D6E221D